MLKDRSTASAGTLPKCHFFTTFFYEKLAGNEEFNYRSVARWTKKIDVFSFDKIIIPIHLGVHWTLAVINLRDHRFEYYDSMVDVWRGKQVLEYLRKYIIEERKDKKGDTINVDDWEVHIPKDVPRQGNGYDCGVFTCQFANWIAKDEPFVFGQRNMEYFRKRMVVDLVQQKLRI